MRYSAKTRRLRLRRRVRARRGTGVLAATRPGSALLAHLRGMNESQASVGLEPVLTTSELAAHLGVPVQTLHDLRHGGRGPRGFRIGRELRYRVSEVRQWLATLEDVDTTRRGDQGEES